MPSSRGIIKGLLKIGYVVKPGKGSHSKAIFEHGGKIICWTVIQESRDIPKGTLSSIKRNICLSSPLEFSKMLSGDMSYQEYLEILKREGKI